MTNENRNNPSYNDLIGDILSNDANQGRINHLEGAGKPLSKEYLSGDTFQHFQRIAKDAGYKPYWLKLQHEIRDELIEISTNQKEMEPRELSKRIKKINKKIGIYNRNCPPPFLKGKVSAETINQAFEYWR
ncbi:DnaJ family domain-containing protein [Sporosarcina pasteurii]|uniref:Domain of uncharacterized function (DUF1992) n=1 Tax=Sporosarcina pasteurii TaxID=1474 RepID=A0A380C6M4_SPOPA|nr:DnaJ family domain-containing protein [Sporosarcina pasteurii]MDS9473080.1 DUF1992 domain-containing protein [Sporosarcina pasteurii]QBQ04584.1 DUF1992 domain-containing protein [Sporosarcina pasteurii]SUJ13992.1 Domain of uncharacterised function (DUF1992) [Sporosarcina pasteurii]